MRISCIIATKGRPEPLRMALQSIVAAVSSDDEALVVDGDPDQSARAVVEQLQVAHPEVRLRHLASEPGLTLQRNRGIDEAEGHIVAFFDDDVTFSPELLDDLAAAYGDETVVGVTGVIREQSKGRVGSGEHSRLRRWLVGGGREGTMTSFGFRRPIVDLDVPRDVEYMPGPLMTARRSAAAETRFDERLTGYGLGEDDDFSYRLSRRGRIRFEPALAVDHHEIGFHTMDHRARDSRQIVNRTYLFEKNFATNGLARATYVAFLLVIVGHRILNREWSGLRGLSDGLRHIWRQGALNPDATD
jgi:glycosyltransferase involved in cell wall biosynthesis